MKKFTKYILTFAALAFASVACVEENLREESPADHGDCYGVYFPSQEVLQETQVFVPEDNLESQILIRRSNANGRIVVPVKVTTEHEDIFSFPEVVFEDGEKETYFTISFPDAADAPGTTYTLSMTIEDELYASYYSTHAVSADFACLVEKWNLLTDPNPVEAERTPATMTEVSGNTFFSLPVAATEVEIYQNDLNPNKFRVKYPFKAQFEYYSELIGVDFVAYLGQYYAEPAAQFDFELIKRGEVYYPGKAYEFTVDRDDFVDFETPIALWINYPGLGPLYAWPQHSFLDWPDIKENKVLKWQTVTINDEEVQIPAAVQFVPALATAEGRGWANEDGSMETITIIFPGQNLLDYSVELTPARNTEDDAVAVDFELGADVDKVLYGVFEGELSSALVESKVEEMMEDIESLKEITASGTELITCAETGKYTLIALSFAAPEAEEPGEDDVVLGEGEGEVKPKVPEVMDVAYTSFGFTKGDDDTSVNIKLELVATDKNSGVKTESKVPMTSENSLEFFISGTDIKVAKMGLYKKNHLSDKAFVAGVMEELMDEEDAFDDETLDLVNGGGYSGYFEGLVPGVEYALVVYAYNGYAETIEVVSTNTDGEYVPMMDMDISIADIEPLTPADLGAESWAFFAQTSYYDDNTGSLKLYKDRDMISDVATVALDPSTYVLTVNDMFKSYADVHEFMSDAHDFELDPTEGYLYYVSGNMNPFYLQADLSTETVAIASLEAMTDYMSQGAYYPVAGVLYDLGLGTDDSYCMVAGKVADGAIAFVQSPDYQAMLDYYFEEPGYSIAGFSLETYIYSPFGYYGTMDYFMHPLFVDTAKYDLSDYKPGTDKVKSVRGSSSDAHAYKPNSVETPEGARKSSIEAAKKNAKPISLTYHLSGVKGERDARPADFTSVSVPFAGGKHQLEIREIGGSNLVEARR